MPYYVYRVGPFAQLHKLAEFDAFKPASAHAKALRAAPDHPPQTRIKLMFAGTRTAGRGTAVPGARSRAARATNERARDDAGRHRPPGRGGADQLPHRRRARRGRPDAVHLPAADARALPLGAGHRRAAAAAARGGGAAGWRRARRCGPSSRRATSRRCRWTAGLRPLRRGGASMRSCGRIGLVYGAGHVAAGRASFFLGRLERAEQRGELELLVCGVEQARGLAAPVAALQGSTVLLRQQSLQRWLWEKYEAWTLKRQDGRVQGGARRARLRARRHAGAAAHGRARGRDAGAARDRRIRGRPPARARLAGACAPRWPSRRADLYVRALRDHLADCLVTLPTLLQRRDDASLHFWFANLEGVRALLFPRLWPAYAAWCAGDRACALARGGVSRRQRIGAAPASSCWRCTATRGDDAPRASNAAFSRPTGCWAEDRRGRASVRLQQLPGLEAAGHRQRLAVAQRAQQLRRVQAAPAAVAHAQQDVVVRVVQPVDHREEALHVDVAGLAGVEDVLLVFGQRMAEQLLDLEQRDVHRARHRPLHLDLESSGGCRPSCPGPAGTARWRWPG